MSEDQRTPDRAKLLIVHYQRHHFETALSLISNLKSEFDITIWSNFLHAFGRKPLLLELGVQLFEPTIEYDALVLVTGEEMPSQTDAGPRLWDLLHKRPVVRVMHRASAEERPGEIRLFPKSRLPFIPASTNIGFGGPPDIGSRRSFLIQGNVENRRNYEILPALLQRFPDCDFNVVGLRAAGDLATAPNLNVRMSQPERDFHAVCAGSTFILPLIDPQRYRQYFEECFTSSIQMGLAYDLPFVAHKDLFGLYPIVGYPYSTPEEFFDCVGLAARSDPAVLQTMKRKMAENRAQLMQDNINNFRTHLDELRP